jgi:tetratricopeptide (TPR) repeat protein
MRSVRADVVCRIARICESSANFTAAIQLYERASSLAPRVIPYWTYKGLAEASAGVADAAQLQASFQSLRHALDLNPLDPDSCRTLAAVYMQTAERSAEPAVRSERLKEAIALYQRAARLAPNYPESYCGLGRCYFLLGEHAMAAELYDKSLKMNPHYARTYMFMGEMHYRLKNPERALQDFEMAARYDRGSVDARRNLGFLLALLGRKAEAIPVYLDALKHAPKDTVLLRRLSALYFSQGDSGNGNAYARRAYDLMPATQRGSYESFLVELQNP